jgi:hypothetical protein
MPDASDVTEDRGLKALFTTYPTDTVRTLLPELVAKNGDPVRVEALAQELPLPDLSDPSRFLDMALRCTWADGTRSVIVLVEHWSEARKVQMKRVLLYLADLALRNLDADVLPVILVTDPKDQEVPEELRIERDGALWLYMKVRVVRVTPTDLPRLRSLQSMVSSVLATLALRQVVEDAVEVTLEALRLMAAVNAPLDDLRRFLPLTQKFAKLRDSDEPRFRQRLREEPTMGNVLDDIWTEAATKGEAQGIAKGKAEGKAEAARAMVASIRRLVAASKLPVDGARAEIADLMAAGVIPQDVGQEALKQIG